MIIMTEAFRRSLINMLDASTALAYRYAFEDADRPLRF